MIFGGRPQVPAAAPTPPAAPSPVATMASRVGNTGSGMGTAMRTYNMGQAQAGATSNPFLNYVRANRAPQAGAGMMNSAPGSAYTLGNTQQPAPQISAALGKTANPVDTTLTDPQLQGPTSLPPLQSAPGATAGQMAVDPNASSVSPNPPPLNQTAPTQPIAATPPPSPTWHPQNLTGLNRMQSQRSRQDMGGLNRLYY